MPSHNSPLILPDIGSFRHLKGTPAATVPAERPLKEPDMTRLRFPKRLTALFSTLALALAVTLLSLIHI